MASEQKSGQDGGQLEEARAAEEIVLQRLRDFGIPVPQSGSSGSGNSRTMVIIDGDEVTVIKRSRRKAPSLRGLYSMMARSGSVYAGPMLQSLYSLMAQSGGVYATSALQGLYSLMAQSGGVYATSALRDYIR